jgi:hypothetical protein
MKILRRYGRLQKGDHVTPAMFSHAQWEMMERKGVIGRPKPELDETDLAEIKAFLDSNGINFPAQGNMKDETYRKKLLALVK